MSRDDQTRVLRLWFAGVTVIVLLASLVVLAARSNIEGPVAIVLIIFQIPLFVPAIVYYFGATEPSAAKVCGMILAGLTLPVAFLVGIMEEPPYTLVGGVFFLTLISSIVGAVISRSQRGRRPDKARVGA